jgi:uncharacterized protein
MRPVNSSEGVSVMMLVKTFIGPSPIHGIGVFAAEKIAKHTLVWEFTDGIDQEISKDAVRHMSRLTRQFLNTYAWINGSGAYVLCSDNGRYFNHADEPNTYSTSLDDNGKTAAARDVEAGEELTCDYNDLEPPNHHKEVLASRRPAAGGALHKVAVKKAKIGKGIYALVNIARGEVILKVKGGQCWTRWELSQGPKTPLSHKQQANLLQVHEHLWMEVAEPFLRSNHACTPNAELGKDFRLRALASIKKGEEITWDYETWMINETWCMTCRCGTANCRGKVNRNPVRGRVEYD